MPTAASGRRRRKRINTIKLAMNPISEAEEDCYYHHDQEDRETYGAVRESGGGGGGGGGRGGGGGGGEGGSSSRSIRRTTSRRCEECGNQAKKSCVYNRCRNCCKRRDFDCQTHVKSTWIPLSQRQVQPQHLQRPSNPKRYRQDPPPSHPSGSEDGNFPAELHIPATFRCLRVNSEDNAVDQYAYQTEVEIGGHRFKGILYDQGLESAFLIQPTQPTLMSPTSPIITTSNPDDDHLDSFMPFTQPYP